MLPDVRQLTHQLCFVLACIKFQDFEGDHVEKMLVFALNYSDILKRNNEQTRTAQIEFHEKLKQFTGLDLIDTFVEQKRTGVERPGRETRPLTQTMSSRVDILILVILQFEEIDNLKTSLHLTNSAHFPSSTTPDLTSAPADELIVFDQLDSNLPSFQAHFPVSSPQMSAGWGSTVNMKKSDSNRGKNDPSGLLLDSRSPDEFSSSATQRSTRFVRSIDACL